ncbi:MAG: ZIP family metal transporter [Gemmatimonadales bacterium]|nr:ZIP family metal transporter [Gemmatimonadota bacterium]MCL4214359.1 ZIP family metal transporter [Gemmatimonadales bacterium]
MTAFLFAVLAAAGNIAGAAAVTARPRWSPRSLELLLAFAAGFLLVVSLTGLLPEAVERGGRDAALIVLVGFLLVHLTQHALVGHFHFGEETHQVSRQVSASALAGLLLHTIVDGVAIASAFQVEAELGMLVFGAVFLHKVPEGLAIASLWIASGRSRASALGAAGALGVATVLGFVLTTVVDPLAELGLALSAGVTLYVGASNLIPEFQGKAGWTHNLVFFVACGVALALRAMLGH